MSVDTTAIRARAEAASPGPWSPSRTGWANGIDCMTHEVAIVRHVMPNGTGRDIEQQRADRAFIAHARTDIPALCDEVDELRATLAAERGDAAGALEGWEFALPDAGTVHWFRQRGQNDPAGWWSITVGDFVAVVERHGDGWRWEVRSRFVCPVTVYATGTADYARAAMKAATAALKTTP